MSRRQANNFREERAEELRKLADLLERTWPGFNAGQVKSAAGQCKSQDFPRPQDWEFDTSPHTWGYELAYLTFPGYQPSSKLRPQGASKRDITFFLDIVLVGEYDPEYRKDPFSVLEVELRAEGLNGDKQLYEAWHFDKHKRNEGDTARAVHPKYHLQHGGKNLWKNVDDYGQLIVPEPPRLAHPPLDAILAIDFVLSNFFWEQWARLTQERAYVELVYQAQKLFWKPYVRALAAVWYNDLEDESWVASQIWPQLARTRGL